MLAFASVVVAVLLILLQLTRLGFLIRSTIPDRPRRRMFLASVSFLLTFVGVRILVHRIVNHEGHFQWVVIHGTHIHHLVWGILILLLVGYGWLLDLGRSHSPLSIFFSRLMSVGFGVGAALTLDEFSIWLDLEPDAYWSDAGTSQHRRDHLLRRAAGCWRWGRTVFPRRWAACGTRAPSIAKNCAVALPFRFAVCGRFVHIERVDQGRVAGCNHATLQL